MDKPDVPPASHRSSHIVKETEMKNFAITIAAVLVSVPAILPAGAADTQPKSSNDVLGFDETKIRPPDAEKGEPIARLFYDYIYPNDVEAASSKLTEDEARRLVGRIFGELRKRYMDHEKITATPEEIQQFVTAMHRSAPAGGEGSKETKEETQRSFEGIGELYVKG